MQRVLDSWEPYPAQIAGRRRDILAWNRASDAIYGWSRFMDWERETAIAVAAFRSDAGGDVSDPDYQQLINDLIDRSPE